MKVADAAAGEYAVEHGLNHMVVELQRLIIRLSDVNNAKIIVGVEELLTVIDDQGVMAATLLASPYSTHYEQKLRDWLKLLSNARKVLSAWLHCQQQWLRLRGVFNTEGISSHLAAEIRYFAAIEATLKRAIHSVTVNPRLVDILRTEELGKRMYEMIV